MEEIAKFVAQNYYLQAISIVVSVITLIGGGAAVIVKTYRFFRDVVAVGITKYVFIQSLRMVRAAVHSYEKSSIYLSIIVYRATWILMWIIVILMYVMQAFITFDKDNRINSSSYSYTILLYFLISGIAIGIYYILSHILYLRKLSYLVQKLGEKRGRQKK